jgi:very-short-patch-repair endonuclease/predicted transcriptional regulator of viral defense system
MVEVSRIARAMGTEFDSLHVNQRIAWIAGEQHGVISLAQLEAAGLSPSAARRRVAAGSLVRLHRGVFAVGHGAVSVNGRRLAAVLACGSEAALSHRSAAALWGLRPWSGSLDVSIPSQAGRRVPGVALHRCESLTAGDVTEVEAIPCTTVARTLLDLAASIGRADLAAAITRAEQLRIYDGARVEAVLERAQGKRGARLLRSVLADWSDDRTRSHFERELLAFLRRHALPKPEVNTWITVENRTIQPDFLWPGQRVILETDGYATHATRKAFADDRRRDQLLTRNGWTPLRAAYGQLDSELARTLRLLLAD